jgi:sulfatase modifying factor 1
MADTGVQTRAVRLFFSYSHRDQDLWNELEKHLAALKRANLVTSWHDRLIEPGAEWAKEIDNQLNAADIILLLVSADFINSDYCWGREMERALERHDAREARVIPVILRPCDWETAPFARIQALPRDALPVSDWPSPDRAFADVARGIRLVAQELARARAAVQMQSTPREEGVEPAHVEPRLGPQPGEIRSNPIDGQPYVWIPPGEFLMGAPDTDEEADDDESPQHRVKITRGFWLGQTPVTVAAYKRFVKAMKREMPVAPDFNSGWKHNDNPIVNVTWSDAAAYCEWAGGHLPTEAEWEYAARAGSAAPRYGDLDQIAWYEGNSGEKTHPVGGKLPNTWNLHDMLGNVWEWVSDWYQEDYYRSLASPVSDPTGPAEGTYRVLRGGSWYDGSWYLRAALRNSVVPVNWNDGIGFRCAREVFP